MKETIFKKRIYHYTAVFESDPERGGYAVAIPVLPGCISEGDTFEEAQKNIREAAELYLEVMREREEDHLPEVDSNVIVAPIEVAV